MRIAFILFILLLAGCSTASSNGSAAELPAAPWDANQAVTAPRVVLDEWMKAENREVCAPLTIADPSDRVRGGTVRRANFGGGWGVAWDVPGLPGREPSGHFCASCGRGVIGLAGAGVLWDDDGQAPFPFTMEWAGENTAHYGLEGGSGPNWLAQIRVADQRCVYYVWSFLGREHLEFLIGQVRRVNR